MEEAVKVASFSQSVKGIKKGAFTAKANAAGESVHQYAEQEQNAPGVTGKQARLALTFEKIAANRRKGMITKLKRG